MANAPTKHSNPDARGGAVSFAWGAEPLKAAFLAASVLLVAAAGFFIIFEAAGRGSALLALISAAFGMVSLMVATRGIIRNISTVLMTTVVFALIVELLGSIFEQGSTVNNARYDPDYFGGHPLFGWGPQRPGIFRTVKTLTDGTVIYDVQYTIDANLLRKTESNQSGPMVAFFGDSWTFGEGVEDTDTLPQAFSEISGNAFYVVNFGFHGYGPQHFLRALESGYFDRLIVRPKLFVFQTMPWHALRVACKPTWMLLGSPRYVLAKGSPVLDGSCAQDYLNRLRRKLGVSAAYRSFLRAYAEDRVSRADLDLYVTVVLAAIHLARQKYNVETVILFSKSDDAALIWGAGRTNDDVISALRQGGARLIDVTLPQPGWDDPIASYAIPNDGHPSPLAHGIRATMLYDLIGPELR
jgi:hypothetical protein